MQPVLLTWVFQCEYMDGTVYEQTRDDISKDHPERSCFTDVMQLVKDGKKIRRFGLFKGTDHIIVDLLSGRFQANGLPLLVPLPPPAAELQLWYTRTRRVNRTITYGPNGGTKDWEEPIIYNIGWVAEYKGQQFQQIYSVV